MFLVYGTNQNPKKKDVFMEDNRTNNDKIKSLPKDGIRVFDGEIWVKIFHGIEFDKSRPFKTYTHKRIQEIAKITKSQLNHLVQTKTIVPYKEERGRGGRSTYDYTNLLEVMFCREMRKFSIGIHIIKNQLDWLRNKVWGFNFRAFNYLPPTTAFPKECLVHMGANDNSIKAATEVHKRIESGEFPNNIETTLTIWEFFRIYGFGEFYFAIGNMPINEKQTNKDHSKSFSYEADLYEAVDVSDGLKNNVSSILINLSELKREADLFQKG
jgi:hypothetical protein